MKTEFTNDDFALSPQRPSGEGWVYIIQMKTPQGSGPIKIGITKRSIESRIGGLSTTLPYPVIIVATKHTAKPYNLEQHLHNKFVNERINGEWFQLDDQQIMDLTKELAIGPLETLPLFPLE